MLVVVALGAILLGALLVGVYLGLASHRDAPDPGADYAAYRRRQGDL